MKKKNNRRLTALAISSLVILQASSAFAASLNVKVRQLNPAGASHAVLCVPNTKCLLPLDIRTASGKSETVTAEFSYSSKVPTLLAEFRTKQGYFYTGEKNPADRKTAFSETIWRGFYDKSKAQTFNTTLFLPAVPNPVTAMILRTAQNPVADLEITVEVAP